MGFSFYPKHEHNCPNVSHCPHLGGAALGTLVLMATANSAATTPPQHHRRNNSAATTPQQHHRRNITAATSPTEKKKRGAPVGHPRWFRKTPAQHDWAIEVTAPKRCPHCSGAVTVFDEAAPICEARPSI